MSKCKCIKALDSRNYLYLNKIQQLLQHHLQLKGNEWPLPTFNECGVHYVWDLQDGAIMAIRASISGEPQGVNELKEEQEREGK